MAFLCRLAPEPQVYHLPSAVRLRGELVVSALATALEAVTRRHDILRTCFPTIDGRVMQRVLDPGPLELPLIDLSASADPLSAALERAKTIADRPFALETTPPWRTALLRLGPQDHLLLFVHHHLVWDGWSIGLLIHELAQGYEAGLQGRAPSLPALPAQYADHARAEREQLAPARVEPRLQRWRQRMGDQEELRLPTDRPRPPRARHRGASLPFLLPDIGPLRSLCRSEGCTLFMGLLAAFGVVLSRWSGQEAFPLGTPVANRVRPEHAGLIGFFANVLVLPLDLRAAPSFRTLLQRTRASVLTSFQDQDLPFDVLVDGLGTPRDARRNPIFQVMLALHAESLERMRLPGLEVEPVALSSEQTHFDLGLHLWHRDDQVHGYLSYDTDLFDQATVARLLLHLHATVEAVCAQPDCSLDQLDTLDPASTTWLQEPGSPVEPVDPDRWRRVTPGQLQAELVTPSEDHRGLLVCGGPLPMALARRALATLDRPLAYGLVGSSGELLAWQPVTLEDAPWASPGRADRRRLRLRDPTGRLVPIGAWGQLHLDGEAQPDHGRWRADGRLELDPIRSRQPLFEGQRLDLDAASVTLVRQLRLAACWIELALIDDQACFVVRVVEPRASSEHRVKALAEALLPGPVRLGFCTRLPLDATGRVDAAALRAIPLLDLPLLWQLSAQLGLPAGALSLEPVREELPLLHLWECVPQLRRSAEVEQTSSVEQGQSADGASAIRPAGPAAWTRGPELRLPSEAPTTLAHALVQAALTSRRTGQGLTTIVDGRAVHRSYDQLLTDALSMLGTLQELGLGPGDRLVLQLPVLADHFTAFWACVLGGITPVTVAPPPDYDQPVALLDKLLNAWRLLGRPLVMTQESRAPALRQAMARLGAGEMQVLSAEGRTSGPPGQIASSGPEDLVFFQLTSGSTGIPKVVPETNRAVLHQAFAAAQANGYGPTDLSVNWLPLDHVVPTLTSHLRDVVLGITQVHAETSWVLGDPLRWLDLLSDHRATLSWSPNFGFKLVAAALNSREETAAAARRWDLSRLRYIMNAGEQVTLSVVEEFLHRTAPYGLGEGVMQPAYGMAEVATAVTFRSDFRLESASFRARSASLSEVLEEVPADKPGAVSFINNGRTIPGVEIRIADHRSEVLPERMIGRIQMRGPVVNPGYLDNPEANAEAFVGDGWFDSGDLGFLHQGELYITGRRKEVIIVRGANFYCYEIEDVVGAVPGVEPTFVAATAVDDPTTGSEGLAVFFVPRRPGIDPALLHDIREAIARRLGLAPTFLVPLERHELPKTTSGKIQRSDLKHRLAQGDFDERLIAVDRATTGSGAFPSWFYEACWIPSPDPLHLPTDLKVVPLPPDGALPAGWAELLEDMYEAHRVVLDGGPGWGGLVGTLSQELPGAQIRLLESVDGIDRDEALRRERFHADVDPRVRWREGQREVRRLRPVKPGGGALLVRRGGRYLITGGLGGLGVHVATMLLRRFEAHLLLLGQSPLDEEHGPVEDQLAPRREATERRAALATLGRLPGSVRYRVVDVTDRAALEACLGEEGPFDGAFHLAGRFPIRIQEVETPETWASTLAPKLTGFDHLDALLPEDALMVSAGSVYGELGTYAGGAYAVANSMLAERARQRQERGRPTRHLDFSLWRETGLSRDFAFGEQAHALGLCLMEPTQAVNSLLAALAGPHTTLIVGLDAQVPNLAWRSLDPPRAAQQLLLDAASPIPADLLHDPLGHVITPRRRTTTGGTGGAARAVTAPTNALERTIAAAWCEVLGLDRVDIDTTFFGLGGQSIQLIQVLALLERSLDRKLSVVDLFRYPTVRSLAASLGQDQGTARRERLDEAQDRGRRLRQAQRPPPSWSRRR